MNEYPLFKLSVSSIIFYNVIAFHEIRGINNIILLIKI